MVVLQGGPVVLLFHHGSAMVWIFEARANLGGEENNFYPCYD